MAVPREVKLMQLACLYDFNHRKGEYNNCMKLAKSMMKLAITKRAKKWCKRAILAEGRMNIYHVEQVVKMTDSDLLAARINGLKHAEVILRNIRQELESELRHQFALKHLECLDHA